MTTKTLLIPSLVGNAALLLAVLYLSRPAHAPVEKTAGAVATNAPISEAKPLLPASVKTLTVTNVEPFDWRRVESSDYAQYISNLRAIGCPESTIRDIIVADVNKLFTSRAKAERGTSNRFEYWKGGNPLGALLNEETIAKQQALGKEKRELLQTLLGNEAPKDLESGLSSSAIYESLFDFLPPEKQAQVKELEEKFAGKLMGAMKNMKDGDASAMKTVLAEKDQELQKVLGADDKFQYDLRMSQTAMVMRMQMGDFQLSEQEFQDIFKLRKPLDDQFGIEGMAALSKADQEKRDAARKTMNEQVKGILGDRYNEYKYEMGGDWAAQMLRRVAKENNVSRENALKAFAMTDLARAQADTVKADPAQSANSKQAVLQSIHDETVRNLNQVLGQDASQAYLKKISLIPGFKSASAGK